MPPVKSVRGRWLGTVFLLLGMSLLSVFTLWPFEEDGSGGRPVELALLGVWCLGLGVYLQLKFRHGMAHGIREFWQMLEDLDRR